MPYLWKSGYRTLRLDLFGHGYSDRPPLEYGTSLFVRQLSELLERVNVTQPIHVLAHSMGAAVVAGVVAEQPERFRSIALHAPMLDFQATIPLLALMRVPFLGEFLMSRYVVPSLMHERDAEYSIIEDGRWVEYFRKQIELPGFGEALLSMMRHGALGDQRARYRKLGATGLPVLVFRGTEDTVLREAQVHEILRQLPESRLVELHGKGHGTLLSDPLLVAAAAIDFFRASSVRVRDSSATAWKATAYGASVSSQLRSQAALIECRSSRARREHPSFRWLALSRARRGA